MTLSAHIALEVRGEPLYLQFTEIPFVFGVAYLAPWQLATFWIATSAAVTAFKYRSPWFKAVFNSGTILLKVALGYKIIELVGENPASAWGLAATAVAVSVAESIGLVSTTAFVRWIEARPFSGLAGDVRGAGYTVVGAAIGTWALLAAVTTPALLTLPVIVIGLIWQFGKQQMTDRQAYKDLMEVHGFLEKVAETEPALVLEEGLEALRFALSCEWAAVEAPDGHPLAFVAKRTDAASPPTVTRPPKATPSLEHTLSNRSRVVLGPTLQNRGSKRQDGLFTAAVELFDTALTRAELQTKLDHDATHDPTTGLLARRGFGRTVDQSLERTGGIGTVLVVDLARFGEVNKTLGFKAGDALLARTAERLTETMPPGSLISRLNADSFAAFVEGANHQDAMNMAAKIRTGLTKPIDVHGLALSPVSRIGIAIGPLHGTAAEELLRAADVAADAARTAPSGVAVYRMEADLHSESRLELLTRLRTALNEESLQVWFQPKIDAISGRPVGAEALLRWKDEDNWISPELFIPAAEAAGMMNELTDFVLRKSLAAVARWRSDGYSLGVAVNLSPSSLEDSDLPARIAGELQRFQIDPPSLTIEITESVVMGLGATVSEGLDRLRNLGVRISVDDFGTGYSSLRYLKDLDIDELKLDRSFVQDLAVSDRSATIARAVIGLGHNLGLQVVAEGVETVDARGLLNDMGCDVLQGFLVARPMDESKLVRWLSRQASELVRPDPPVRITENPAHS